MTPPPPPPPSVCLPSTVPNEFPQQASMQHSEQPHPSQNSNSNMNDANLSAAASFLRSKIDASFQPTLGIVCGSGLNGLADLIQNKIVISYKEIPGFTVSTVAGHAGKLVFGYLENKPVICMMGRLHPYEGWNMQQVTFPIRTMILMGIQTLIVTNAAGGLNPNFKAGDIMVFEDHIALPVITGNGPLMGPNNPKFGPRFPALSDAYDRPLRKLAFQSAHQLGLIGKVHSGVYCFVSGPQYESRAEARFLRSAGVDAVGMSTVPEVIVARHMGVKVIGFSLITNVVVNRREQDVKQEVIDEMTNKTNATTNPNPAQPAAVVEEKATHEEVLQASNMFAEDIKKLARLVISQS